jgi:hypothetical protein
MSFADQLLILWLFLVVLTPLVLFVLNRRNIRLEQEQITLAYLRGQFVTGLMQLPRQPAGWAILALKVALVTLVLALFSFLFAIFWMHNETRLYLLSFHGLIALLGVVAMFSPTKMTPSIAGYYPKPNSIGAKVLRVIFFLTGALVFGFGSTVIVRDNAFPLRIVEGGVNNKFTVQTRRGVTDYKIIIDGKALFATHDVYDPVRVGDRVRAEIGTGSNTIFRIELLEPPPKPTWFPPIPPYPFPAQQR